MIANCKWDTIKEQYISFMAERGKQRFSLFITPSVRDILLDIFDAWEFQFMNSFIVRPQNWILSLALLWYHL